MGIEYKLIHLRQQNILSQMCLISVFNSALIVMGIAGIISPVTSVLLQNIATTGICAGSMRPFLKKEDLNAVSE